MSDIYWTEDKVAKLWDYYAANSAYQNQYFSFHSGKYIVSYISRHIKLRKFTSFLDFGCGPGYLLECLLKICKIGKCYGVDFSRKSVELVNNKFKKYYTFGGATRIRSLPLHFDDSSMDFVSLVEVVEHLDDKQLSETLKEVYRVLRPGGYVVITTPNNEDLEANKTICPECECIFHRWQHIKAWNVVSLRRKMEDIDFYTLHISETFFTYPLKKLFLTFKRLLKRDFIYPHLIYIGKK